MSIESYIPDYPDQIDPDIQYKLSNRLEFSETAAKVGEKIPKRGELFAHQKLFSKIMTIYDSMLLIAEPGTGKTISFLSATEQLVRKSGLYKRAYILENGRTILDDVYNQLVQKVAPPKIYEQAIGEPGTKADRKKIIKAEVEKFYTFDTYTSFTKQFKKMTDDAIIREFSDCVFVLDETHNIQSEKRMSAFNRLFSIIKNKKIMLITATPMINDVEEISNLMNLILPIDKAFPKGYPFTDSNDIERRCRGFVSYVRDETKHSRSVNIGNLIEEDGIKITLFYSEMGDLQRDVYKDVAPKSAAVTTPSATDEDENDAFYINSLEASLFVFPDGSFGGRADGTSSSVVEGGGEGGGQGGKGVSKFIEPISQGVYKFRKHIKGFKEWGESDGYNSFPEWLSGGGGKTTRNLARLSGKFATIIRMEMDQKHSAGTSFVYSETKNGGGAIFLGLCFELFGFSRFAPSKGGGDDDGSSLPSKRLRYALLTTEPETSRSDQQKILDTFNSPENVDGEYIKVLIGSRITRDGINIFHCVRVHLLSPIWTESGAKQAISRALRAVSHETLFNRNRSKIIREEGNVDSIDERSRVTVSIYRHTAVVSDDSSPLVSADRTVSVIAAKKDYKTKQVARSLKRAAIDCVLNYDRNVSIPLEANVISDYTAECDYAKCEYVCGGGIKDVKHSATIRNFVYDENSKYRAIFDVNQIFSSSLKDVIPAEHGSKFRYANRPDLAIYEAGRMADYSERIDGKKSYIITTTNKQKLSFHTSSDIDLSVRSSMLGNVSEDVIHYAKYPMMIANRNFREAAETAFMNLPIISEDLKSSLQTATTSEIKAAVRKAIEGAGSFASIVKLFENLAAVKKDPDNVEKIVYSLLYKKYEHLIKQTTAKDMRLKNPDVLKGIPDDSVVYIHRIFSEEEQSSLGEYSVTVRSSAKEAGVETVSSYTLLADESARIFVEGEDIQKWRFVTFPDEVDVIVKFRTEKSTTITGGGKEKEEIPDRVIYGIYNNKNRSFRIVDKRLSDKSRGRVCKTLDVLDLISAIVDIDNVVDAETIINRLKLDNASTIIKAINSDIDIKNAKNFAAKLEDENSPLYGKPGVGTTEWRRKIYTIGRIAKDYLCNFLIELMREKGLMVEN